MQTIWPASGVRGPCGFWQSLQWACVTDDLTSCARLYAFCLRLESKIWYTSRPDGRGSMRLLCALVGFLVWCVGLRGCWWHRLFRGGLQTTSNFLVDRIFFAGVPHCACGFQCCNLWWSWMLLLQLRLQSGDKGPVALVWKLVSCIVVVFFVFA